jgi:hypothetical protein
LPRGAGQRKPAVPRGARPKRGEQR